jgi:HAE1 family hydrophobic/amphiphilic exporter-1
VSPALERARRDWEAARLVADRERPRRGAGLTAGALAGATLQGPEITFPEGDEGEAVVVPKQRLRLELAAQQVLYRPGGRLAALRSDAAVQVADLELGRAEGDVANEVTRAFLGALAARAGAEAAARGAEQARAARQRVAQLLAAGRATPGERLQAEAEAAEAERAERGARREIVLADATLNRLLGRPLDAEVELIPPSDPPREPPSQEAAVAEALARRADLEILRRQANGADAGAALAALARRPTVTAGVGYALQTPSAFVARSSWSAGVTVAFPLWDGDRARLDAAEARARAASAREGLVELESAIQLEILQARTAVLDAADRIESARRGVAAAAELLRATEMRLERGLAAGLELVTARAALRRAEADATGARWDLHRAWADLERALGRDGK